MVAEYEDKDCAGAQTAKIALAELEQEAPLKMAKLDGKSELVEEIAEQVLDSIEKDRSTLQSQEWRPPADQAKLQELQKLLSQKDREIEQL